MLVQISVPEKHLWTFSPFHCRYNNHKGRCGILVRLPYIQAEKKVEFRYHVINYHGRRHKCFQGFRVDILLILFKILTLQRRWTYE